MSDAPSSTIGPCGSARPRTAAEARSRLEVGHQRFDVRIDDLAAERSGIVDDATDARAWRRRVEPLPAAAQDPFALVIGCADARVPIERLLGQGINDLFVLRVAGHVLGGEILGSVDFAVSHLPSLRLAVVMGHTDCGAVEAAVRRVLPHDGDPSPDQGIGVQTVIAPIEPAVQLARGFILEQWGAAVATRPGFATALAETSVVIHAALTAGRLRRELDVRGMTEIGAVAAVFDVRALRLVALGAGANGHAPRALWDPPIDDDGLAALGAQVATSGRVVAMLQST